MPFQVEDYNPMVIDQVFMNEFLRLAREINGSIRLTASTSIFHRESSLRLLYNQLEAARTGGTNIEFEPDIKRLIAAVPQDKQRQYSMVIKYVEKRMTNQGSHIFASLKGPLGNGQPLSEKLSKSQQRFTNPLLSADTGHGLCAQMALLWLKEQLDSPMFGTKFPRLATGNVVGSKTAYALTSTAADLKRSATTPTPQAQIEEQMRALGLRYIRSGAVVNFETFQTYYQNHPEMNGFYIGSITRNML